VQGMGSGTITLGGLFMFFLDGSPILVWLAIFSVFLGCIFVMHVLMKRRKEAREARGRLLPARGGAHL